MTRKQYSFWNPRPGQTYNLVILEPVPTYAHHWIRSPAPDGMTPEQRAAKKKLDDISKCLPARSWLDRAYFGKEMYVMPGTSLPAYRYTFITNKDQRATKELAARFERDARELGYPIRACAHLTRSLNGQSYYWKVEAYFPVQMFRQTTR